MKEIWQILLTSVIAGVLETILVTAFGIKFPGMSMLFFNMVAVGQGVLIHMIIAGD